MRQMSFDPKNKNTGIADYPKLKLAKDERARILCPEEPVFAYVHTLRAPTIVNGQPKYVSVETKSGDTRDVLKMDFIGRPLCLGDEGILEDKGADPKNCPICELATTTDMAAPPERRFAMHVVKYTVKSSAGGFELASPFSCQLVVWAFPDSIFNKLVDFVSEWGSLQNHDLLLGPCTAVDYQKFDIGISAKAAWQESEENKRIVKQTIKENKAKDLEAFCGRKVDRAWVLEDLEKIQARWRIVNGQPEPDGTQAAESLTEGLDDLLKDHPGGLDEFAPHLPSSTENLAALLGDDPVAGDTPTAPPSPTQDADQGTSLTEHTPAREPAAPEPAGPNTGAPSTGAPLSFDDLLNQLDA